MQNPFFDDMTFQFPISAVKFLCFRGFALVGPFVVMIYQMLKRDFLIFFVIYMIFVIGFSQGEYRKVMFVCLMLDNETKPAKALQNVLKS